MKNQLKTLLLLGGLSALFISVGAALGPKFLTLALLFALALNVGGYFFSDRLILRLYRAEELPPERAPALHQMVDWLCVRAGIPKPRLYLLPDAALNAFATGRNPAHGAVAVTEGLLQTLGPRELRGVLAHELAHIKNRDTLVSTLAAVIASALTWLAHALSFAPFLGRSDDDDEGSFAGTLAMVVLAPLVATLLQLAVSRSREYLADETGAAIAGDSEGLARALEQLEAAAPALPAAVTPATASLFIVNPLAGAGRLLQLFSTHPPMAERISRLRQMSRATRDTTLSPLFD